MGVTIDRTGEERINNFGSKMIITRYNKSDDIDVYFPEYNWTAKNKQYGAFKRGNLKCPYEPRYYGKGYLGEGKYEISENGKLTNIYIAWHGMLKRCYDEEYHNIKPGYNGCVVEDYLLNFQHFGKFYESIYYKVPNERMELDKDILKHGNKIYSRETCIFVPQRINSLLVKNQTRRGCSPIGVIKRPSGNYEVNCRDKNGNKVYLGVYSAKEEAYDVYKRYKEKIIKQITDSYGELLPKEIHDVLYNYEVHIDD